ncbi:MAG: VWA domain-containing protein [Nitrosomonas sp.]|jgi:Ca-activated chloride channel family protein|nr:VWA domain-containing protein [Nitrosomonas sp.]
MEEFHFLRPLWFLALIPALWLLILRWRRQSSGSAWHAAFDPQLLSRLWLESPGKSARLPFVLLASGWLLTVFILAGPVWERQPEPVWRAQLSRILILDLSPSMDARDLTPSRLERARFKISDILERSREGRNGLVVFAGEPHIVTPLTEDTATIRNLITALNTEIIPAQGDSAAPALQMTRELLTLKGVGQGELLLITDGIDDPAAALAQARQLRERGHTLSILGVGTESGGAIMNNGIAEVTRFDAGPLEEIARAGGGAFSRLTTDDTDLNRLLPEISTASHFNPVERNVGGVTRWVEYGVWLMPVVLLLAAAAFRRGWLLGFAAVLITPPPAHAFGWNDLWLRADQQAHNHLQQGDAQTAAQQFRDPGWRGMALYEAGDYSAAAQAFAESGTLEARYNRGNALARAGELQQAIDAYRDVLQQDPHHEDAKANLELLEKMIQEQQQQDADSSQSPQNADDSAADQENNDGSNAENKPEQQDMTEPGNNDDADNGDDHDAHRQTHDQSTDTHDTDGDQPDMNDRQQEEALASDDNTMIDDASEQQRSEEDIALEQWLRQIPEDPAGLLRRKFMLEHMQRKQR